MSFPAYPVNKQSGVEWLGEVPEHWSVLPVKWVGWLKGGSGFPHDKQGVDSHELDFHKVNALASADSDGFLRSSENTITRETAKELGAYVFPKGTIVFAKVGAALLLGRLRTISAEACLDNNMMGLIVFQGGFSNQFVLYSMGAVRFDLIANPGAVPSLNEGQIGNYRLAIPGLLEQTQIARFLDHETTRIDALIEEQQRLIELLKEKRQAVISHAVTKGLDPMVPMKDSGVEWLGEVPAHWEVKQLKHVVDPNTSITYGIVQAGPEFEGGIPYIRTSDMSGEELPISGYPLTSPEIDESYARSRVRPGDIVMSIRASVGKCLPVPDELKVANLTQGTAKISAGQGITRSFLLAFLNAEATQNYFDLMAKGATFKEITLDALRRTPVLLPPAGEQIKINQFVVRHAGLLDETRKQAIRSVSLLQERRSALVSAAVTGKIDVRGWQPPANAPTPELAQEAV